LDHHCSTDSTRPQVWRDLHSSLDPCRLESWIRYEGPRQYARNNEDDHLCDLRLIELSGYASWPPARTWARLAVHDEIGDAAALDGIWSPYPWSWRQSHGQLECRLARSARWTHQCLGRSEIGGHSPLQLRV